MRRAPEGTTGITVDSEGRASISTPAQTPFQAGQVEERLETERERRELDAHQARQYVNAALSPTTVLYREIGPDRLLQAALVFATLARG